MADNLIFGKSIIQFGAVGDGKHDDTKAFVDAFNSNEALICIPFGQYNVNEALKISSGVRINTHPCAVINFKGITAKEKSRGITIIGGTWNNLSHENVAFDLSNSYGCTLKDMTISGTSSSAILLNDCENAVIQKVSFVQGEKCSGVVFTGNVSFTKLKGLSFNSGLNALHFDNSADIFALYADDISLKDCENGLFAKKCLIKNSVFDGIDGSANINAFHFEDCELSHISISNSVLYNGYWFFENTLAVSLKIEGFKRLLTHETSPIKPTLVFKACPKSTLIFDGIALDAIILAKRSVPNIKMTAAKMVTATPTMANYTLELSVSENDGFVVPYGDFDTLNIFAAE